MRVAIFAHTNDSPELDTGVTTYNQELVRELCERFPGCAFSLYLAPRNAERFAGVVAPNLRKIVIRANADWAAATPFMHPGTGRPSLLNACRFAISEVLYRCGSRRVVLRQSLFDGIEGLGGHDMVLYSVFGYLPDFPLYVARTLRIPCISVLHDIRVLYASPSRLGRIRAWLRGGLYKYLVGRVLFESAAVLVPSRFIRSFLQETFRSDATRIWISYVVPDSLPESLGNQPDWSPAVTSLLQEGNGFLFYPSTIVETKNHLGLVQALALVRSVIPEVKLVLAGSNVDSALGKEVRRRIGQLGLEQHVLHLGFVSEAEKVALYKGAVALVVPSIGESFSLPIWEAFSLGCPVIASTDRDIPEQVDGAAILCNPHEPADVAEAISRVWGDQVLRRQLAERGRRRYLQVRRHSVFSGWEQLLKDHAAQAESDSSCATT